MRSHSWIPLLSALALLALPAGPMVAGDGEVAWPSSAKSVNLYGPGERGGKTCSERRTIPDSPSFYSDFGNNCSGTTNVWTYRSPTCNSPDYPGPEVVYQVTFSHDFFYLDLSPLSADLGLFLISDCASPATCVDFHDAIGPGVTSTLPRLIAGGITPGTYYVFVDSYYAQGANSCGSFALNLQRDYPAVLLDFTVD